MSTDPLPDRSGSTVREDGGYVGQCSGCQAWYWNYWGAGTYCPACLHGYCDTLKGHWDDAEIRGERLEYERDSWRSLADRVIDAIPSDHPALGLWLVEYANLNSPALDEHQRLSGEGIASEPRTAERPTKGPRRRPDAPSPDESRSALPRKDQD